MADCCSELKIELSKLRAEVSKLKPVNEEAIIEAAYQRSKAKLYPFIEQALAAANLAYKIAKSVETVANIAKYSTSCKGCS